jgi:hypothetical protein
MAKDPATVSVLEASRILGITSREMIYRLIRENVLPVASGCGTKAQPWRLYREGLREAFANRPQRIVSPARTERGRAARQQSREVRGGGPPPVEELQGDRLPDLDEMPEIPKETPNLEEQRAWVEFEKRYKLRMESLMEAKKLVYREDHDTANKLVLSQLKQRAERIAPLLRTRIPGLPIEIFEEVERLVREMLEGIADNDYSASQE